MIDTHGVIVAPRIWLTDHLNREDVYNRELARRKADLKVGLYRDVNGDGWTPTFKSASVTGRGRPSGSA
jgi:hypothetical protein